MERGLGRIPKFDERSKEFPVRAVTEMRRRSYSWGLETTLDQGPEGSCVGHAWAHELLAKPSVAVGVDHRFAREKIYWEAQKVDGWEGGAYPEATKFYEGTSVLAGAQVVAKLGGMKEYRWSFSLEELVSGVGYAGPCVLGIDWHSGMFSVGSDGFVRVSGDVAGGHAILCRGVNLKLRRFLLHNSWGSGWGRGGCAYLSFEDADKLLGDGGEAVFPVGRKALRV